MIYEADYKTSEDSGIHISKKTLRETTHSVFIQGVMVGALSALMIPGAIFALILITHIL